MIAASIFQSLFFLDSLQRVKIEISKPRDTPHPQKRPQHETTRKISTAFRLQSLKQPDHLRHLSPPAAWICCWLFLQLSQFLATEDLITYLLSYLSFFQFFYWYFLHLHFKCYPQSPLYPHPTCSPIHPLPLLGNGVSPVLGHIKFVRPRGLSSQW